MARERYPGERRGLSLFLEDLRQAAGAASAARNSLLVHAIRRALRSGDLDHLRHARTIFNHLPRDQRRELSAACVARSRAGSPPAHELLERYSQRAPSTFVSFESTGERWPERPARVAHPRAATGQPSPGDGDPGTLPRSAAGDLRRIAAMIERDRRLLSEHYWRRGATSARPEPAQTPKSSS